tara:strand:- start:858 stop:2165 length:1308 start_codon:yes stop_codon:yes gene_type:complete
MKTPTKKNYIRLQNDYPMYDWCKNLFYICRSITGDGIKKTLSYFENINPILKRIKFKTNKRVFDWKIPYEWNIKDAYIEHESGKRFAEFKKNNLHVVNFSSKINKVLKKKDLIKFIHSIENYPSAIPYVTTYYKKSWGFCMDHKTKKKLPNGRYKVVINSNFSKGNLDISHALLKGKKQNEIFFSSYVCHPSMANNELSGPVVLNALLKYIRTHYKKTTNSYRFVLLPETIGSIAYLSKYKDIMKKKIIMGFNLSCLGDNKSYSIIKGPNGNDLSFEALYSFLKKKKNLKIYDFIDRGSDERQYCAPGIDLPLVGYCRSKYGKYKEYHTSKDNLSLISQKSLNDSLKVLIELIDCCEISLFPRLTTYCEPSLSKRNLYPTTSKFDSVSKNLKLRKDILAFSNGQRSIFEISNILNSDISLVKNEVKVLIKNKLLR